MLNKVESAKGSVLRGGIGRYPGEVEGTACANRVSQTREELDYLFNAIEQVGDLVNQLGGRLHGVIRQEGSAKEPSAKEPLEIALVPLAEDIRTARKRVQTINENIVGLLQSIEL